MASKRGWDVYHDPRVRDQLSRVPLDERGPVVEEMRKMRSNPWPPSTSIRALRTAPRVSRIAVGRWRVLYVVFPGVRRVYVGDVVVRSENTYAKAQLVRLLREAMVYRRGVQKRQNPGGLSDRLRGLLARNPAWGDAQVARAAGCSPAAVRKYRVACGIPARHAIPWLHST